MAQTSPTKNCSNHRKFTDITIGFGGTEPLVMNFELSPSFLNSDVFHTLLPQEQTHIGAPCDWRI